MRKKLISHLENLGFLVQHFSREEFTLLYMNETEYVNAVLLLDNRKDIVVKRDSMKVLKEQIEHIFPDKCVHVMMLILTDNSERDKELLKDNPFCWLLSAFEKQLLIYETQVSDFYGLKNMLECFLQNDIKTVPHTDFQSETTVVYKRNYKNSPYITYGLLAINVIVFLLCTVKGNLLYNTGMLYGPSVFEDKEFYRLITCMFLHSGMSHLTSNMLVLVALGDILERKIGHVKFFILYVIAGIGGGLTSIGYGYYSDNIVSSIGASGAVFGMVGALLLLVIINRGSFSTISLPRLIFAIALLIYDGLMSENIDNAAHIGGLLTGFIIMTVLTLVSGKDRGRE